MAENHALPDEKTDSTDANNDNDAIFSDTRKSHIVLKDSRFADSLLIRSARAVLQLIKKTTGILLSSATDEQKTASHDSGKQR